jgi:hypothetical protein
MARLSIAQTYEPVEVDLWGSEFHTKPATRSSAKLGQEIQARIDAAPNDSDEAVKALAELVDLRLQPANGKRTKASTLIVRKWEADELSMPQLFAFLEDLGEADRPT